jgi:hypothetical protein
VDETLFQGELHQGGDSSGSLAFLSQVRGCSADHLDLFEQPYLNVQIFFSKNPLVDSLRIHLSAGTMGETASLGEVAIIQFHQSPSPGLKIGTQGQACSAGGAEIFLDDAGFKRLKSPVFQPYFFLSPYFESSFDRQIPYPIKQIPLPGSYSTGRGMESFLDERVWTAEPYGSLSMMVATP